MASAHSHLLGFPLLQHFDPPLPTTPPPVQAFFIKTILLPIVHQFSLSLHHLLLPVPIRFPIPLPQLQSTL